MLPFVVGMGERIAREIRIEAQSEGGTLSPEAWARDIGTPFPVSIEFASVVLVDSVGGEHAVACCRNELSANDGPIEAEIMVSGRSLTQLHVRCGIPGADLKGLLKLKTSDRTIELVVKAV